MNNYDVTPDVTPRRRENRPNRADGTLPAPRESDYDPREEKRRFREEKETGDIDRQDVHATFRGIT
jgi:hypothetical protein